MKQKLIVAAVILGPLVWLFGRALVCDEMFVYRDAAHYYYPLYRLVTDSWAAGRIPLWNSQENLGQPLLADATAAVLYPGKLIFASPLGYDANCKLYIVGHVLLAAIFAYVAARGFGRSAYAAALAAVAYAFGGSVLFQYCNVVYLVSAAWLPLAALAIDRMLRQRGWRWAIALGAVLAMMTLGGDPQTAYHAGLAAILYALILWCSEAPSPTTVRCPHRLLLLGAAALALLVLAAVQILPSAEWTRRSTRAAWDQPRNIYEAASSLRVEDQSKIDRFGFLLGRTTPGQHDESYEFSVAPWHLATFVWPNILGQVFPTNTRWINALPAETRTWTPSLYVGLLPLVLALSQLRLRRSATNDPRIRWLSWLVLLALFASFGWFSLGWLARDIYFAASGPDASEPPWGSPFGGLYWLLNSLLPGYAYFRYPAKWLTFVSLGLSLLAAYGWDNFDETRSRVWRILLSIYVMSIGAALAVLPLSVVLWEIALAPASRTDDALFGPLDAQQVLVTVVSSIVSTFAVASLLLYYTRSKSRAPGPPSVLLLALTCLELALLQSRMIATAPAAQWRTPPAVAEAIAADLEQFGPSPLTSPRIYRSPRFLPSDWQGTTSPTRQSEGQAWDRDTLLPKYHLLTDLEMVVSSSALRSADMVEFQNAQRSHPRRMTFERYRIASDERRVAGEPIPLAGVAATQLVRVDSVPRVWVVHEVTLLPPLAERNADAIWQRSNEVLTLAAKSGFAERAIIETDRELRLPREALVTDASDHAQQSCEIVSYEANQVVVDVRLTSPGIVVFADAYDPDWQCVATDMKSGGMHRTPVLRTNRILRGVEVPAGHYQLNFVHKPASVFVGGTVSAIGWLALAIAGSQRLAKSLRERRDRRRRDALRPG